MYLGTDLSRKIQEALQEIGIKHESRKYSREKFKSFSNIIGEHIYSQNSKFLFLSIFYSCLYFSNCFSKEFDKSFCYSYIE